MLYGLLIGPRITAATIPFEEFPARNLPPTSAGMLPENLLKLRSKEEMLSASLDAPDSHCAGTVPAENNSVRERLVIITRIFATIVVMP